MGVEDGGAVSRTGLITKERNFLTVGVSPGAQWTIPGIQPGDYIKSIVFSDFIAGVPQDGVVATDDFEIVGVDQIQDKLGGSGTPREGQLAQVVWYSQRFDEDPGYFPDNNPSGPPP